MTDPAPTYVATLPAAKAIVLNATSPAEARELLMMLGLVVFDPAANRMRLTPDDVRNYDVLEASPAKHGPLDTPTVRDLHPERCTTPAGLRELGGAA